ncbi:MAG: DUF4367 domain-containing protein [Clostridia bacterium]|nr:DUF4367 domain-containing protein [Clostridia bacterium]
MFDPKEKALLQKAFTRYQAALAEALPVPELLQSVSVSEKTERRMERLLYHQKHFYYTWINTAAKRAACILIALFLAATVTTVSVEALREGFVRFVIETFEKGSTIWFSKEDSGSLTYPPIVPKLPTYLPDGYHLAADMSDSISVNMIFEREGIESINFVQQPRGSKMTVNSEGAVINRIVIKDTYEGIIFENLGGTYLVFNDGEYMYTLIGTVSEKEIIKIAESIPFEEK